MRSAQALQHIGQSSIRLVQRRRRVGQHLEPPESGLARSTEVVAERHGDGVLEIRLVGSERRNALARETIDRIESLASVPPVGTRVILLTAEGPDFCAGYDLIEASRTGAEGLIAHNDNFRFLKRTDVPVIAVLHGNVIGGGLELALAADVRLATTDTRFAIPANRLRLIYSEEGVRLLVNELGESVTRAMLLTGKTLSAEEAMSMGVVSEVVPTPELVTRAIELATTVASWPPLATSGNRRLVDGVVGRVAADLGELHRASFVEGGELLRSIERFVSRRSASDGMRHDSQKAFAGRASIVLGPRLTDAMSLFHRVADRIDVVRHASPVTRSGRALKRRSSDTTDSPPVGSASPVRSVS